MELSNMSQEEVVALLKTTESLAAENKTQRRTIKRLLKERAQFKEWLRRHHCGVDGCGWCGWPDN